MDAASNQGSDMKMVAKLNDLQTIISKMPLHVCWTILPEFNILWRDITRAVRNSRLPMHPSSIARLLYRHAERTIHPDEINEIVSRLRLRLVATQNRKWHVINLLDPINNKLSVGDLIQTLPQRIEVALRNTRAGSKKRPEVQSVLIEDLIYLSVQLISTDKEGSVVFAAWPPRQPVALVSSVHSTLLKGIVQGLGYKLYEDAKLFGHDKKSLLRINDRAYNEHVDHLVAIPEYNPVPIVTKTGIDFTNKIYNENYVESLIGPDPPLLNDLTISSSQPFFDASRLNKMINMSVRIESEDVAKTLKNWVAIGAMAPTSELLKNFHKIQTNKISYDKQYEDDEE